MLTDVRLREAWSHLESGGADALALDVFDCLLWRLVPQPAAAFVLLGERLAANGQLPADITPAQFAHLRLAAEAQAAERARAARGAVTPRLDETWALLLAALPGAGRLADLVEAELAASRAVCRVDLAVAELAEHTAVKLGLPVYLVATESLSPAQLERLLDRPELDGIPFAGFATSPAAAALADGRGTQAAATAGPSRVLHLAAGDDGPAATGPDWAAVTVVRRGGVGVGDLRTTLEREGLLAGLDDDGPVDREYGDFGLTALRAAALRHTDSAAVPAALRRYWETGATVFGPVFTGFAEWVVERTRELGADEALCLMRAGRFLAGLLDGPGRDARVAATPLWVSRRVLALANVFDATPDELRTFLTCWDGGQRGSAVTVGELLRSLGVDLSAAPGISALAGRRLDAAAGLLAEILDELLATLAGDERIRGEIVLAAGRVRERLLGYLDERLPDRGPAVLVDLGWDGTIQVLLARLLAATGREAVPVGLYLATGPAVHAHRLAGHRMEGYLASGGQPASLAGQLLRAPGIVEQVAMADVGALTGFDETCAPLLSLDRTSRTQQAQRAATQDGVYAFQRQWLRYRRSESPLPSLGTEAARRALLRILARFVSRPTAAEAAAFAGWQHDGDPLTSQPGRPDDAAAGPQPPARRLAPTELIRRMPYLSPAGLAELPAHEAPWPAAVAAVSNRPLALVTELAAAAGVPPAELSAPAAAGPIEVYVDTGDDFARGPKATAVPSAGRDGLALVRLRVVDAVGARRVRLDPAGRRGLLRLDWLTFGFHVVGAGDPIEITFTTFDQPEGLGLVGLRVLQSNLVEILDDDPQVHYNVNLSGMPELGGTYAIDVELAFAWLGIRPDPVLAPPPGALGSAVGQQLPRRAARRVMRQLGGLR
ncbi:MAG: haloacid dehalogenase [Frankia sp.]|nr:haloacid dehalogenase [Frankia sp.]